MHRMHAIRFKVDDKPKIKLDLGCGPTNLIPDGYIGIDRLDFGQTIVWDILDGIPLPDNSVSHIFTSHFLEHVPQNRIEELWEEMYRVLCNGGRVTIRIPHASDTRYAFIPGHQSQWTEKSIECLCNMSGDPSQDTATNFRIIENKFVPRMTPNNIADELHVILEALK